MRSISSTDSDDQQGTCSAAIAVVMTTAYPREQARSAAPPGLPTMYSPCVALVNSIVAQSLG